LLDNGHDIPPESCQTTEHSTHKEVNDPNGGSSIKAINHVACVSHKLAEAIIAIIKLPQLEKRNAEIIDMICSEV
jgi:hypothetical protein